MKNPAVLFVCTGNICRSPTAHALLLHKAQAAGLPLHVDSAGISDEEHGRPPDARSAAEAARRGIAMPAHRARQVRAEDFQRFDWLIGMTAQHVAALRRLAPAGAPGQIALMADFADDLHGDIPDPWYGGSAAFVEAFELIERGVDGLLARLAVQRAA